MEFFGGLLSSLPTAVELGLFNALTVLALFLSYSMLNVCDLSTDGCYTLGAAVGAVVALYGHPYLSIPAAMLCGIVSGFVTAILQTKMGVDSLLAGIIVNTGLYSVNIAIMGDKSLLNLNKTQTIFTDFKPVIKDFHNGILSLLGIDRGTDAYKTATKILAFFSHEIIIGLAAVVLVIIFLSLFLRTRLGLAIRATGNNPAMVRSSSIDPTMTTIVGLCIANSFTALSGCLFAQSQKSMSIDVGTGMVTVALASLLIGGTFLGKGRIPKRAVGAVLGAVIFRIVYTVALRLHMPSFMLKLVSSVIVIIAISGPYLSSRYPMLMRKLKHRKAVRRDA